MEKAKEPEIMLGWCDDHSAYCEHRARIFTRDDLDAAVQAEREACLAVVVNGAKELRAEAAHDPQHWLHEEARTWDIVADAIRARWTKR